ncbi:MAG TPA: FadR/GntR family transcriptional regulator [Hyphomicrobiales bacterium]|nr:FadR/GntR family transcriptional regulator [Hyphomicrobiales bacterium]
MDVTETLFEPIEHASVVDSVVNKIEDLILAGVLKDGMKLPSERELSERMKVSRPKLRDALKRLEGHGLIVSRHGEGTFVAPLIGTAMSPALVELYSRRSMAFLDYMEFRTEMEAFAASLAADRATETDKAMIGQTIQAMESAHEANDNVAAEAADIHFHTSIMDASHNSLLIHTMTSIYDLTSRNIFFSRGFLLSHEGTGERLIAQHKAIYQAIVDGKPDDARKASVEHLEFVKQSFIVDQDRERREAVSKRKMALSLNQ